MDRRRFLATALAGAWAKLIAVRDTRAQESKSVYRIGILQPGPNPQLADPLIAGLGERGWVGGRNLVIEFRYTDGDSVRAEALARDLVEARMDVIVTNVTATAMAARRATSAVPIVMLTSGFPVEGGLANSLRRPGGNVTGITVYAGGGPIFGKYVELLRELVPHLREFGVLWGFAPPSYKIEQVAPATDALRRAANALKLNMRFWETGTERALVAALASAANLPLDALFVTSGTIHGQPEIARRIAEFAVQRRLPTVTDFAGRFFPVGGVLAYSASPRELAARTAHLVDRILRGAKPEDLPIEQPTMYELSVNLKLARTLGLTIPPSLLARADQVIE
jgi:putative tryptophan/tyrosine transport system substrate-binding protein